MASKEYCEDQQSDMSSMTQEQKNLVEKLKEEVKKNPSLINEVLAVLSNIPEEHQQQSAASTDDDKNNAHAVLKPPSVNHLLSQAKSNAEEQESSMAAKARDSEEESNLSTTDKGLNKMSEIESNFEPMKAVIKDPNSSALINKFMETGQDLFSGNPTTEEYADESIKYSHNYEMNHPRRGGAVIFSHTKFSESLSLHERDTATANIEASKFSRTFERFGFTIQLNMDQTYKQISEILSNLAAQDHSEEDCLVVAVSTHGGKGFLMASDGPYNPEKLWTPFIGTQCPSLAGKPKLFFIEACQCSEFVPSSTMTDAASSVHTDYYRIPSHADLIIMSSTVEGFHSFKNRQDGAWFISALSDVLLQSDGSEDLLTLLHQVSGKVALEYKSDNISTYKQVPCIRSTLTRKIHLKPEVPMGQNLYETGQISKYKTFSTGSSRIHHKFAQYSMDHCERGFAIIFDHQVFEPELELRKRVGSNVDASSLERVFEQYNFTTVIYSDLKTYGIHQILSDLAKVDHSDNDCLIVTVLTHGLKPGVLYSADNLYSEEMLWSPFLGENCPSLAGKPKIFLIQACQGMKFDHGVLLKTRVEHDSDSGASYRIPSHEDFLIVHSSFQGFVSWRNTTRGSWFIESFCTEMMEQNGKFRFLDLLTRVCRRVAIDFESSTEAKQMPSIHSTLTKDFIISREDSKRVSNEAQQALTASRKRSTVQFSRQFQLNETAPVHSSSINDSAAVKNEYLNKEITSTLEPQKSRFSINLRFEYPMEFKKQGRAIIFNHEEYHLGIPHKRLGTQEDVKALKNVFEHLRFDLIVEDNPTFAKIQEVLDKESKGNNSDTNCLVVCVLTHGLDCFWNDFLYAYDSIYSADKLWVAFKEEKCYLRGKPKIFFIQACRGSAYDHGTTVPSKAGYSGNNDPGKDHQRTGKDSAGYTASGSLPPDTLVAFSCSKGYYSFRDPKLGTLFIRNLANELLEGYKNSLDLVKILTRTSRHVAIKSDDGRKEMPVVRSTLTRKVYF